MKKFYILIIIIILSLIGLIIYFNYGRSEQDSFYAIKEAKGYVLKEDGMLHIDIYSKLENSLISYKDKNIYQIKDNDSIYNLENVNVNVCKMDDLYLNRIDASLINTTNDELKLENAILCIKNESYTLHINIGYISILNPINYELLSFNKYYGSYSYINGELRLVGINLELTDKFNTLSKFNISGFSYGKLDSIKYNLYDNEVNIKSIISDYNPFYLNECEIKLSTNTLFIPIAYKELLMIKESYITLNLDGIDYYIDHFSYISNALNLKDYESLKEEGKISYVKSS